MDQTPPHKPLTPPQNFSIPGHNGSPTEPFLGRSLPDFESTNYSWNGYEEIVLENIISASLNQEVLRKNFEILMNGMKTHGSKIVKMAKQQGLLDENLMEIKHLIGRNESRIGEAFEQNKEIFMEMENLKILQKNSGCSCQEELSLIREKLKEIDHLKDYIKLGDDRNSELEQKNKELVGMWQKNDEKIKEHDLRFNEMSNRIVDNTLKINEIGAKIRVMDGRIDGFESKVRLIESLKSDNGNNNFSEFINQLDVFQKSLQKYLTSEDLKDLHQSILDLNNEQKLTSKHMDNISKSHLEFQQTIELKISDLSNMITPNIQRITVLEEQLTELINKPIEAPKIAERRPSVSLEMFNALSETIKEKAPSKEIENLYEAIRLINEQIDYLNQRPLAPAPSSSGPPPPAGLSPKDALLLKESAQKIADLEGLIRKAQKEIGDNHNLINNIHKDISGKLSKLFEDKLDKSDSYIQDKFDEYNRKIFMLENEGKNQKEKNLNFEKMISIHEIGINDLQKEITKLRKRKSGEGGGINKDQLIPILDEILGKLRGEIGKLIEDLRILVEKKIELPELWKSEGKNLEKLDEVVCLFMKKFCDKNETKKAFIYLENKINELHEAVFGPKEEDLDGDALVAKKNLWTCISCDKDLDKYQGKLGDYKGWAQFPPKNTNPDKMGKFGSGYNRMLDERKDNIKKDYEKIKRLESKSITNYKSLLPEITR